MIDREYQPKDVFSVTPKELPKAPPKRPTCTQERYSKPRKQMMLSIKADLQMAIKLAAMHEGISMADLVEKYLTNNIALEPRHIARSGGSKAA